MDYATVQDLVDRFGEQELIQLTDPDLLVVNATKASRALADAQSFIDGFIGRVYSLPLSGCVKPAPTVDDPAAVAIVAPPQLTRLACDVARYYLYDDLAPEHEVYLRFKAADRELQAMADGKVVVTCPWGGTPGTLVSGSAPGDGEVLFGFSPRQVTDDSMRGFA